MATPKTQAQPVDEQTRYESAAAEWDAKGAAARAELAELEASSGAAVLDDPDGAVKVTARIAEARARVDLSAKASAEARRRAHAARVAGLQARAAEFDAPISEAQRVLEQHLSKRDGLLRALEEFSGAQWRMRSSDDEDVRDRVNRGETVEMPLPVEWQLQAEVEQRQAQRQWWEEQVARVSADPDHESSVAQQLRAQRADWARVVEEYRGHVAEAVRILSDADRLAGEQGVDETFKTPPWLAEMRADAQAARDKVALFPQDIEHFRAQLAAHDGKVELQLPEVARERDLFAADLDRVEELLVEFGLKEPEPEEEPGALLEVGA